MGTGGVEKTPLFSAVKALEQKLTLTLSIDFVGQGLYNSIFLNRNHLFLHDPDGQTVYSQNDKMMCGDGMKRIFLHSPSTNHEYKTKGLPIISMQFNEWIHNNYVRNNAIRFCVGPFDDLRTLRSCFRGKEKERQWEWKGKR